VFIVGLVDVLSFSYGVLIARCCDVWRATIKFMNLEMSDAARDLLERERWVIADLRALLGRLEADEAHIQELKTALEDLKLSRNDQKWPRRRN
jgi:hypothetical protein